MGAESQSIPPWAHLERQRGFPWIEESIEDFWRVAQSAFAERGRGGIVVNVTSLLSPDAGHPSGFLLQEQLEQDGDENALPMLSEYDPSRKLVLLLRKTKNRTSTYRIRADRRAILCGDRGGD
jgi:hypothetical protein